VGEIRFWFIGFRVIGEVQWSVAYYNVQAIGWKGRVRGVLGVLGFLEFLGGVGFGGGESGFVCRIMAMHLTHVTATGSGSPAGSATELVKSFETPAGIIY
jgi:hypothetical protein